MINLPCLSKALRKRENLLARMAKTTGVDFFTYHGNIDLN